MIDGAVNRDEDGDMQTTKGDEMTTTRTLTEYTVTAVDLRDGGDGRIESQTHLSGRDAVKAHLTEILDARYRAGRACNAQIMQDAETASWQLARWHGDRPIHLDVFLTRYDVDFGDVGTAGWQHLRDAEHAAKQAEQDSRDRDREITRLARRLRELNEQGITATPDPDEYAVRAVRAGSTVADLNSAIGRGLIDA